MIDLKENPELKPYLENILVAFKRYWCNNLKEDVLPTTDVGWEIQTNDKVYQIKVNINEIDKYTCDECIYWEGKCLKDEDLSSIEHKIHCKEFVNEKRCWYCKNYLVWNSADYACEFDLDYLFNDWNDGGNCPKFEVDV